MRDLTKSVLSYSWAMSLFGLQQALNLFAPSRATTSFDNVTGAAREQLGGVMKATFRAGDNLQRGMIDAMCGVLTGQALNPGRWTRTAADVMRQSADAVGQGMRAAGCGWQGSCGASPEPPGGPAPGNGGRQGYSQQQEFQGWGPMPDSDCEASSFRRSGGVRADGAEK